MYYSDTFIKGSGAKQGILYNFFIRVLLGEVTFSHNTTVASFTRIFYTGRGKNINFACNIWILFAVVSAIK